MVQKLDDFFFNTQKLENRIGFSTVQLCKKAKEVPSLRTLIEGMHSQGFHFAGDTLSSSKACTDTDKKRIFIHRKTELNEATLSLSYELINAKHSSDFKAINSEFLHNAQPSEEKSLEYAKQILHVESEAVFMRSSVAMELGLEHLIKNKKYTQFVQDGQIQNSDKLEILDKIYAEMVAHGTVHRGEKKALDHYAAQYFIYNHPSQ